MTAGDPCLLYINGTWQRSSDGSEYQIVNPATGRAIGPVPRASAADIDDALGAAAAGFLTWSRTDPWERCRILRGAATLIRERSEDIAAILTHEQGKPLREATAEVKGAWEQFDWFADEARRITAAIVPTSDPAHVATVYRVPVGPVAAFSPWNFPALLPSRKIAPALAAGCSVILKPADEAPGTALALAAACHDAGLPPGVLNVLTGDAAKISERLLRSPVIRKLTLTGSVPVGQRLLALAAENIIDTTMELGGHAPVIVLPDVDPIRSGRACARAKFRNAGQVCIAPTRFYVHRDCYPAFREAFVAETTALRLGDGADPAADVGPLTSERRVQAIEALVTDALACGATLACGGSAPDRPGFFFEPTVLADVPEAARAMQEEPFGPLALLAPYREVGEAIVRANGTPFGLAAYVWSADQQAGMAVAAAIDAGLVGLNHFALSYAGVAFGGVKASGIGTESGAGALDAFLVSKSLHTDASPFPQWADADD
ncbi:MAG: NAD-dependent succinate-semialdehyde dehydrogenase [Streptosporangiaceae bacterium]